MSDHVTMAYIHSLQAAVSQLQQIAGKLLEDVAELKKEKQ